MLAPYLAWGMYATALTAAVVTPPGGSLKCWPCSACPHEVENADQAIILVHRERDEAGIVQLGHPLTAIGRHGDAEQAIVRVGSVWTPSAGQSLFRCRFITPLEAGERLDRLQRAHELVVMAGGLSRAERLDNHVSRAC